MRCIGKQSISSGSILGFAFGLTLGAPMIAGAESSNAAVDRATAQLMLQGTAERPSLQPRPRFAYLLGTTKSASLLTSEQKEGLPLEASHETPSVLIEILPVGKECGPPSGQAPRDSCPIPFPLGPSGPLPLPPIPPMPSAQHRGGDLEGLKDLKVQRMEDGKVMLAATGQAPFVVVAGSRAHHLLPSMKMTVDPPVEFYRLQAVGRFAPAFEPAANATDFELLPCPGQSWDRGLCTPEQVRALQRRSR